MLDGLSDRPNCPLHQACVAADAARGGLLCGDCRPTRRRRAHPLVGAQHQPQDCARSDRGSSNRGDSPHAPHEGRGRGLRRGVFCGRHGIPAPADGNRQGRCRLPALRAVQAGVRGGVRDADCVYPEWYTAISVGQARAEYSGRLSVAWGVGAGSVPSHAVGNTDAVMASHALHARGLSPYGRSPNIPTYRLTVSLRSSKRKAHHRQESRTTAPRC
jgi:hypothetical protein